MSAQTSTQLHAERRHRHRVNCLSASRHASVAVPAMLLAFFEIWSRIAMGRRSCSRATTPSRSPSSPWRRSCWRSAPLRHHFGGIDLSSASSWGWRPSSPRMQPILRPVPAPFAAMLVGILAGLVVLWGQVRQRPADFEAAGPAFIGTLGMYGVAKGVAYLLAGGTTVPVSNAWFAALGNGRFYGVPIVVYRRRAVRALDALPVVETRFGSTPTRSAPASRRRSGPASMSAGTRENSTCSSLCAGLGGVLSYAARFTAGAGPGGEPLLLDSIAAVVIGGASLFGGSGTVLGTSRGRSSSPSSSTASSSSTSSVLAVRRGRVVINHLGGWRPDAAQARRRPAVMSAQALTNDSAPSTSAWRRRGAEGLVDGLHPGEVVALAATTAPASRLIKTFFGRPPAMTARSASKAKPVACAPSAARATHRAIYRPGARRQSVHRRQHLPGARASKRLFGILPVIDRPLMARPPRRPWRGSISTSADRRAGRPLFRRPAPGCGDRPGDLLERPRADHGRADGGLGVPEQRKVVSLIRR